MSCLVYCGLCVACFVMRGLKCVCLGFALFRVFVLCCVSCVVC